MTAFNLFDLVMFTINEVTYQSKIFKIIGNTAYVDYFEGSLIKHRRQIPIPFNMSRPKIGLHKKV